MEFMTFVGGEYVGYMTLDAARNLYGKYNAEIITGTTGKQTIAVYA